MSDKYKFLDNKPIGKDLFEGKSQERIANVIVDIIKDDKFKVIGIDGGWGTGKSNLVKIVDEQLPNHNFFLYDVWGHQEDEQRKSILVELTDFITNTTKSLVTNKDDWKKNLDLLLASTKETTTINQPYLSVGFIFSMFSIIYVPTVNVFKDSIVDFFDIKALFWKLVLVLFPLIIVLGIYVYNLFKGWFKKSGLWNSFTLAAQETFQVYTNKQKEETKIETISDNQPSVRDFRKWMKDIDDDLGNNNLVLVFDNFDRLPKKHILSIWSVIHVFFAETEYNNIKIIIPFDRIHIKNAFKDLNGDAKDYANDYINKTFDIVYRVAPPILSSWKVFFKDNWGKAFPNYNETEYIRVEQAYEVFRPDITPREILAFINEVVTLKLLDDSIPDRYIAVFVLNEEYIIKAPLKAITELDYLKGIKYLFKNDEDFDKYITALAYQIDPNNALEVVYRRQLKECLLNGDDHEAIQELSKTKVFSRILRSVVNDLDDYNKPIEILKYLNDDTLITKMELQEVWNDIYLKEDKLKFTEGELEEFQFTLLDKIDNEHKSTWTKRIIANLHTNADVFNTGDFSDDIDKLDAFCKSKKMDIDVFKLLEERDVTIEQFKLLIDKKEDDFEKYRINCKKEEIEKSLAAITVQNIDEANFIVHLKNRNDFTKFHELLKTLVPSVHSDSVILEKIYNLLKITTNQPIPNILNDAQLYTLMNGLNVENEFFSDLACMRIVLAENSHPSYVPVYDKALNSEDTAFHKRVAERIEHYISFEDLLISSLTFQKRLIKGVIPLLLKIDNKNRIFDNEVIIDKLIEISNANEIDTEILFEEIDKYDAEEYNYDFVFSLSSEFYRKAKESNSTIANQIIQIFVSHFKEADAATWATAFESIDSKELEILQIIDFKDWNSFALEQFKNKLIQIASEPDNSNLEKITPLINSFSDSGKNLENTFKDLRDVFINNNNISKEHFTIFIESLFKYGSLEEKSGDVLRTIFKTSFLDDENCVQTMINQRNGILKLINESKKAESSDFINGVKDRATVELIHELANNLSIKIPKPKKEDEETEDN